MAKIAQLKKQDNEIYPRTLDSAIAVSGGTMLLSTKLGNIENTFDGIEDGSITTGYSMKSLKSDRATNASLSEKAINAVNDEDGNNISETYLKSADIGVITNSQIDSLTW